MFLYSFAPFCFLVITNILLIVDLRQRTSSSTNISVAKKNQFSINVSIVFMTMLFILSTCPSAIVSQYYTTLLNTYFGRVVLFFCDDLTFSYHALNVIILCVFNKLFIRELKIIFFRKIIIQRSLSLT